MCLSKVKTTICAALLYLALFITFLFWFFVLIGFECIECFGSHLRKQVCKLPLFYFSFSHIIVYLTVCRGYSYSYIFLFQSCNSSVHEEPLTQLSTQFWWHAYITSLLLATKKTLAIQAHLLKQPDAHIYRSFCY